MHTIEQTIMLDSDSPLRKGNISNGEVGIDNDLEMYIFSCGQTLSLLSTSIDKSAQAIQSLRITKNNSDSSSNFTHADHIEFAIENFFIRSHGIYDRALLFASQLLDTGIDKESINHQVIVTNSHAKKYGIEDKLKKLRKVCTEYRVERNKIIHHGRYAEECFDFLSLVHKANNLKNSASGEEVIDSEELDKITNDFIDVQVEEFEEHLEKIKSELNAFYELAEKVYKHKRATF